MPATEIGRPDDRSRREPPISANGSRCTRTSDHVWWQTADRRVLARINKLIEAAARTPDAGIGKPERLREDVTGYWSRRITRGAPPRPPRRRRHRPGRGMPLPLPLRPCPARTEWRVRTDTPSACPAERSTQRGGRGPGARRGRPRVGACRRSSASPCDPSSASPPPTRCR
ncbi:type II toxin-antitoxin system YoeB family toxin [Cellulomonas hominis]|uniref:type II toxin-antitoxin system YoeB family toxin n=1 Tax=Cellulomonas hominis TaxID=156981 RepID=UPI0035591F27